MSCTFSLARSPSWARRLASGALIVRLSMCRAAPPRAVLARCRRACTRIYAQPTYYSGKPDRIRAELSKTTSRAGPGAPHTFRCSGRAKGGKAPWLRASCRLGSRFERIQKLDKRTRRCRRRRRRRREPFQSAPTNHTSDQTDRFQSSSSSSSAQHTNSASGGIFLKSTSARSLSASHGSCQRRHCRRRLTGPEREGACSRPSTSSDLQLPTTSGRKLTSIICAHNFGRSWRPTSEAAQVEPPGPQLGRSSSQFGRQIGLVTAEGLRSYTALAGRT
jgi:hypothetical protein